MSKSTGNFMTLSEALDTFGADAMRLCLADSGDSIEDANFLLTVADSAILRIYNVIEWTKEVLGDLSALRQSATPEFEFQDSYFQK